MLRKALELVARAAARLTAPAAALEAPAPPAAARLSPEAQRMLAEPAPTGAVDEGEVLAGSAEARRGARS